jgi:hypothetical protein
MSQVLTWRAAARLPIGCSRRIDEGPHLEILFRLDGLVRTTSRDSLRTPPARVHPAPLRQGTDGATLVLVVQM